MQRILWSSLVLLLASGAGYFFYSSRTSTDIEALWGRHWDEIDISVIKRDYQPWTATQMHDMWEQKLTEKYGGTEKIKQITGVIDELYPPRAYIARMLQLGRPFVDFADYENALLEQRKWLFSTRVHWESLNTEQRETFLQQRGLPGEAKWQDYEEAHLKNDVVYSINFWRSKEQDPSMNGTRTE